tara:strand:+ start:50 stop:679 length:630 start_codon:yes stop_codon:yes gene_type:complete
MNNTEHTAIHGTRYYVSNNNIMIDKEGDEPWLFAEITEYDNCIEVAQQFAQDINNTAEAKDKYINELEIIKDTHEERCKVDFYEMERKGEEFYAMMGRGDKLELIKAEYEKLHNLYYSENPAFTSFLKMHLGTHEAKDKRIAELEELLITIADALNGECDRVPNAPVDDVWWYPNALSETMWERIVDVLNVDPEGLAKRHLNANKGASE